MMTKWPRHTDGEEGVLLSLAVSVGLVALTVAGWCLWKILAPLAQTVSAASSIEMP